MSERLMAPISPFFPLSHWIPRIDDRRLVSWWRAHSRAHRPVAGNFLN